MDIAGLYNDTQSVEVTFPGTDFVGLVLKIRTGTSDEVKAVDRRKMTKAARGKWKPSDEEGHQIDRLCAFIASWDWDERITEYDGKPLDDTEAFKRHVLNSTSPATAVILSEMDAALGDIEAFTRG